MVQLRPPLLRSLSLTASAISSGLAHATGFIAAAAARPLQSTSYKLAICLSALNRTDSMGAGTSAAPSFSPTPATSGTANVSITVSHSATLTRSRSATKSPSVRGASDGKTRSRFGASASRAARISHQCSRTSPRPTLSTFATFRSASPRRTCSSNTSSVPVSPLIRAPLTHRRKLAIFTRRPALTPPPRAFLEEETAMI
ncbi:MAG: hypothetical protein NTY98_07155 [Verrucomicrobia bacterium]|nr:hypothetical protein [Verrucomicrobiota bacterium]